ncbi:phage minor head protein [Solimonas sp. SE-A11]|uniref:phage head morphogenesis protein n=1 Tax=Solimonas sp. SE-A11 TaxID=3054954 RepID=UPI00259C9834|nr:phage minor head protein [Solimonas sp. SE-A11]MDM4768626.1 phage minor head protein [Solimonas sp. SE-A11]
MADPVDLTHAIGLPPAAAIRYFEQKGHRISWNWQDTWQEANARAFTVAKATRMDVLGDIRGAVEQALKEGKTERWFENQLTPVLQAKGWWGKQFSVSPDGSTERVQLGSPQRLKTIYRTNLQTAYMAGRYEQFAKNAKHRPYFQYVAVMDAKTRPTHAAMHGRVFRWDDPIWATHWPPCGFNCRCRVRALSDRNLADRGLEVEKSEGRISTREVDAGVDLRTGEIRRAEVSGIRVLGQNGKPTTMWTDPGWNYNPARAAYMPELDRYPADTAKQFTEGVVTGPEFTRWFRIWQRAVDDELKFDPTLKPRQVGALMSRNGKSSMQYPLGILDDTTREALGTQSQTVWMSSTTLIEHIAAHPEIGLADYQKLQKIIDQGEVYKADDRRIMLLALEGRLYRASVKVDEKRERLFLLSLFETNEAAANTQIRRKMEKVR